MLARNIIRQFLTQILGLFVGFFISIITTRILGVEGRGNFALILNTSSFLSILLNLSFGASIVHVISTDKAPLRETINSVLALVLLLIGVCILLLTFFPFSKFDFFLPTNQSMFYNKCILIILFVTSLSGIVFNSVLNAKKIFKSQQVVYFWIAPLTMVAYIVLYYFKLQFGIDFKTFITFYLFISSVSTISSIIIYFKLARPKFSFTFLNREQFKYILNLSFLAYAANFFQFLAYRMDFWFVQYYSGTKSLGIYSLSVNLAQMLWLLPQAVATIFLSYAGSGNSLQAIQQTNQLCRLTLSILAVVTIGLACTIHFLIPFLYGVEFVDSAFLFQLLVIGIVPFCLTTIISSYFGGNGLIKINLIGSFIGFVACFAFDLLLVPTMGNKGAAIATIISYTVSTVYSVLIYMNRTGSPLWSVIILKKEDIQMLKDKLNIKAFFQPKNTLS